MRSGKFVKLTIDPPIRSVIHKDRKLFGDIQYYLTSEELHCIEEANDIFSRPDSDVPTIEEYDVIGWAMKLDDMDSVLENDASSSSKRRRSQKPALVWVRKSQFGNQESGRLSATLLELACLVKESELRWTRKTGCTTSVNRIEPFRTKKYSEELQQIQLLKRNGVKKDIDFLIPAGVITEIIGRDSSPSEHVEKIALVKLGLLTDGGTATSLLRTLVSSIERWWTTESLISNIEILQLVSNRLPLEAILYAASETSTSYSFSQLSDLINMPKKVLQDKGLRLLTHHREIRLKPNPDESELVPIDPSSGLEICTMEKLVRNLAIGAFWTKWIPDIELGSISIREEVTILPLRRELIRNLTNEIKSDVAKTMILMAPAGWGKTGTLLQIAHELEILGRTLVYYNGGQSEITIPRDAIVLVDDVNRLSQKSLRFLIELQQNGVSILATLSQEYEYVFSESVNRLKSKGSQFVREIRRIPILDADDALFLIREKFPILFSAPDIQRILNKARSAALAPAAIAFLSLQSENFEQVNVEILNIIPYLLFKVPPLIFDVFGPYSHVTTNLDAELTALIILEELGGEVFAQHDKFIQKLAKELAKSSRSPRYYRSFVEYLTALGIPRATLSTGISAFLKLCKHPDFVTRLLVDMYRSDFFNKYEFDWATKLCARIHELQQRCSDVADTYLKLILKGKNKRFRLQILPQVAFIGSNRLPDNSFYQQHYGWLETIKRMELLQNLVTPSGFSIIVDNLTRVITASDRINLDTIILPFFNTLRNLWKKKEISPNDDFNASYLKLLSILARKRMHRGKFAEALDLFDEGIELAKHVSHHTSLVSLLSEKTDVLRSLSPAFCQDIKKSLNYALNAIERITTYDSGPIEAIVQNQAALAYLSCGDIDSAEIHAKSALDLTIKSIGVDPEGPYSDPLEILKSEGWALHELGLCAFARGDYTEARINFNQSLRSFIETRHDYVIEPLLAILPLAYLREGKVPQADKHVGHLNRQFPPNSVWFFGGNMTAYFYQTVSIADNESILRTQRLWSEMKEYQDVNLLEDSIYPWTKAPLDMQIHRRLEEWDDVYKTALEFLSWLTETEEAREPRNLPVLRIVLSYVLREMGLYLMKVNQLDDAAKCFLGATVYWMAICGPRSEHSLDYLSECLKNVNLSSASFSGWNAKHIENCTVQITMNDTKAKEDFENNLWVGVDEILTIAIASM